MGVRQSVRGAILQRLKGLRYAMGDDINASLKGELHGRSGTSKAG